MALWGNSKKKNSRKAPNLPALDLFLTLCTAFLFLFTLWILRNDGPWL